MGFVCNCVNYIGQLVDGHGIGADWIHFLLPSEVGAADDSIEEE